MDLIVAILKSPVFWIMQVFFGTVIGVLANHATRWLDRGGNTANSWFRKISQQRMVRRTERFAELSRWLEEHENGTVLAKLQAITFRLHAVLTSIAAISCFAFGYYISPKPQFSLVGILFFVIGFFVTVMAAAFIKLADDLDSIVATHPKGMGTYPGRLVRNERMKG